MRFLAPAVLCLITFLPQQTKDSELTVPLVFRDRVEIVKLSAARAEYLQLKDKKLLTETESSRFVALTLAIGTVPSICTEEQARALLCLRLEPK